MTLTKCSYIRLFTVVGEVNIVRQVGGLAQERFAGYGESYRATARGRLRDGCELQIVGAIGNQFVTECVFDLIVLQQEGARHALRVAGGKADKIAFEPGHQHARDAFAIQILAQFGVGQPKRLVELAIGIREARQIVQLIGSEKLRGALFRAKMHKRDARAFVFDLRAQFRELGDRLAAKGSAKMTEEHQEQRPILRQRMNGLAGLRTVRLQQLGIESFCLEHRRLHIYRFLRKRQMLAAPHVSHKKMRLSLRLVRGPTNIFYYRPAGVNPPGFEV